MKKREFKGKRNEQKVIKLKGHSGKTMNRIEFIIFGAVIVYAVALGIIYYNSSSISGYEIKMGSLFVSKSYTGFAVREEEIVTTNYNGYINFYVREGERVSTRDHVYSIDETGKLEELLSNMELEHDAYSENDLKDIKNDIIDFNYTFDETYFQTLYDFKDDVEMSVAKLSNDVLFKSMDEINKNSLNGVVKLCSTGKTGYVVFGIDGYENFTLEDINEEIFNKDNYEEKRIENSELLKAGDTACKIITSEDWSLIIPIEEDRIEQFTFDDYMKVRFSKNQNTSWAYVTRYDKDGKTYAVLTFNNSCVTFCDERFVDIELIINDEVGLKIPNSSIIEKDFLVVPKDYVIRGGENGNYGVSKESYDENGNVSYQFIDINIYSATDEEYYIDGINLSLGDYIRKQDSNDGMRIVDSKKLIGVYNMNKGYADFKQINILYKNDEYSIVSPTTKYGLTVYDRIVLDASVVNNNDFIYQ